jgi:hypothetical protein
LFALFGALGDFSAALAFFPAFAMAGATGARRGARLAFFVALGCPSAAASVAWGFSSTIVEFIVVSLAR